MRTALTAGLIGTVVVALLGVGQALTNADFIYMCAGAALLDRGELLVTPYFPPGYPILVWLVTKLGLVAWSGWTALHAGSLLSAIGSGLSAGAVAYASRLYRIPPAPALLLGLLALSLPDMAEIAFNPHLDALYTGLAICLIVATLRLSSVGAARGRPPFNATSGDGPPTGGPYGPITAACLCAGLLLTLRWHAVLVVGACLLYLLLQRRTHTAGMAMLASAVLLGGFSYGALYARTGSLQSAAPLQVATGAVYREYGPGREQEAVSEVFSDYAAWMQTAPPVTSAMLLEAERANLPRFLTRKAIVGGIGLLLLLALIYRRWPTGALPLLLFIPGYCAAVATTYFTPRASALPELCGLILAAAALHLPFTQVEHELRGQKIQQRRLHFKPNTPSLALDPAALGTVLSLSIILVIGYNAWRVQRDLRSVWQAQFRERNAVYDAAVETAGGDPNAVWGRFDLIPPRTHMPWCLPGISHSRLWLDDPRVAKQVDQVLETRMGFLLIKQAWLYWPKIEFEAPALPPQFQSYGSFQQVSSLPAGTSAQLWVAEDPSWESESS